MNAETQHLDPSELEAFALGRPSVRPMRALEGHLADCPACVRAILAVPEDRLLRSLRRSSRDAMTSPGGG